MEIPNPWFDYADEKLAVLDTIVDNREHDFVLRADRETPDFRDMYERRLCLQTYLPPVPYVGKPLEAEIIVLAANPGFVTRETPEYHNKIDFVRESIKSLKFESDYPIHYLDDRFSKKKKEKAYPGYNWWNATFSCTVEDVRKKVPDTEYAITSKMAGIEWLPYHSNALPDKDKPKNSIFGNTLSSQEYTRHLVNAATKREAQLVVIWGRPHRVMWERFLRREFPSGTIFQLEFHPETGKRLPSSQMLRHPYYGKSDLDKVVERVSTTL